MPQHVTFDRPKRRGRRDQFAIAFPVPRVPGDHGAGIPGATETEVQAAILKMLRLHPRVAWVERINVGAGKLMNDDGSAGRFVRFAFKGCSDIVGQLRDGRFLAVEVKRHGGSLRPEQAEFLSNVNKHGGVAFVARKPDDVSVHLAADPWRQNP